MHILRSFLRKNGDSWTDFAAKTAILRSAATCFLADYRLYDSIHLCSVSKKKSQSSHRPTGTLTG